LLAAIELVQDKKQRAFFPDPGAVGTQCRNYCFNDGLICRAIRDTMVLAPPLVVTTEVDEIIIKLKSAIDRTAKDCTILLSTDDRMSQICGRTEANYCAGRPQQKMAVFGVFCAVNSGANQQSLKIVKKPRILPFFVWPARAIICFCAPTNL